MQNDELSSAAATRQSAQPIQWFLMSRLRFLLACLVMLAIPLQGLAAASMLFCSGGMGHHAKQVAPVAGHANKGAQADATGHDHSKHAHAGVIQSHTSLDKGLDKAQSADSQVSAKTSPSAAHTCNVCSACCHSAAISESTATLAVTLAPQADLNEPSALVVSRPAVVPDKPPRA